MPTTLLHSSPTSMMINDNGDNCSGVIEGWAEQFGGDDSSTDVEYRTLGVAPVYHVMGFNNCIDNLRTGVCYVPMEKFHQETFFQLIEKFRVIFHLHTIK